MARRLILNWITAGWRFENTKIFADHFRKQCELLQDVAIKNLDDYYNLPLAEGTWLDQIGEIYGLSRPYTLAGDQFILDLNMLDDPEVALDGNDGPLLDSLYRTLILLKSSSSSKLFCMKNIADNFKGLFGDDIKVEFIENIDYYTGKVRPMYFQLKLYFKNASALRVFLQLVENNENLVGKPMGVSYDIICDFLEE